MTSGSTRRVRRCHHHVIAIQRAAAIPGLELPVLYLAEADGESGEVLRPLHLLTDYFIAHSARSRTWMLQRARGLGLLYDYLAQQRGRILDRAANDPYLDIHSSVLEEFTNHLVRGTITFDQSGAHDDTGLFWLPMSSTNAIAFMQGIDDFLGWLKDEQYTYRGQLPLKSDLEDEDIRAFSSSGRDPVRVAYAACVHKRLSFLAHLKRNRHKGGSRATSSVSRRIVGQDPRDHGADESIEFPRQYLVPLINEGFVTDPDAGAYWQREDLTAKLLTMICAFGGTRRSEPLHLWVGDARVVNHEPVVLLHHPAAAQVTPEIGGNMIRAEYLSEQCDMQPRNRTGGKLKAGWKGVKCNRSGWTPVYWLPLRGAPELFWQTYLTYLFEVRPRLIHERRRRGLPDHPFLFVSAGAAHHDRDWASAGDPYTAVAFWNAWKRAIGRLRRIYDDDTLVVEKRRGTTPHGLRHLYGHLLDELGLKPRQIQECMHHISPLSQLTYTRPRNVDISNALNEAARRARLGDASQFESIETRFLDEAEALAELRDGAEGSLT